eukprot:CAMPEP_0115842182 /NCGR_PEP_ID=MMETSP0287-20121206/7668_1 /TAXON_ID=412157 /ORGANISM="Chrysochromulina rotalis, Strain UIO044" /LENGTH=320 /DNA_ID=CAMNT_0003295843 /DNA_START=14 /DNA_END=976 /DNA_ORIENTATION=+
MSGRGGLIRRPTGIGRSTSKRFVVAVDGSRYGFRAVRLAAWLLDMSTRDKIKCVSVARGMSTVDALGFVKQGEDLLRQCGVPAMAILPGEILQMEEGGSLAETLSHAAVGAHLVMGAGGARLQAESEKRKTLASAAIGSVATQCMGICKAPVILCKPKGVLQLDSRTFFSDRQGGAGMVVLVAVDASRISQKCFDMTLRMVKPGDVVKVVHISNSDQSMAMPSSQNSLLGDSAIRTYYDQECSKAATRLSSTIFEFEEVALKGSSVSKTIIQHAERVLADLVILGSVELAKLDGQALGSVSAAVARTTQANVLVAKNFAL